LGTILIAVSAVVLIVVRLVTGRQETAAVPGPEARLEIGQDAADLELLEPRESSRAGR
jgi:hypothetical protein